MQMGAISYFNEKNSHLEKWLKERQTLIVAFTHLCQTPPSEENSNTLQTSLEEFCELLVDYLCRGHFEMYTTLLQEIENCARRLIRIHPTLLDRLLLSTEQARAFDKAYEDAENFDNLERDLSLLGENLASRFEWEDELISAYLEASSWEMESQPAKSA